MERSQPSSHVPRPRAPRSTRLSGLILCLILSLSAAARAEDDEAIDKELRGRVHLVVPVEDRNVVLSLNDIHGFRFAPELGKWLVETRDAQLGTLGSRQLTVLITSPDKRRTLMAGVKPHSNANFWWLKSLASHADWSSGAPLRDREGNSIDRLGNEWVNGTNIDPLADFGGTPETRAASTAIVPVQGRRGDAPVPPSTARPAHSTLEVTAPPLPHDLQGIGLDFTDLAVKGKLARAIGVDGKDGPLLDMLAGLEKPGNRGVMLIGEPGVGKSATIGEFAYLLARVHPEMRLLYLSVNDLISGTKYRGEMEERIKKLVQHARDHQLVLAIDEFSQLFAQHGSETQQLANTLKQAISTEGVAVIGAMTTAEKLAHERKDTAFKERYKFVPLQAPSPAQLLRILRHKAGEITAIKQVRISDEAIRTAARVKLSNYGVVRGPVFALEEAVGYAIARHRMEGKRGVPAVDVRTVRLAISKLQGHRQQTAVELAARTARLEETLMQNVVGQDETVREIGRQVRAQIEGTRGNRPLTIFLYGPTGVGKTLLAEELHRALGFAYKRFDMGDFSEKHSGSRLGGAPPGYVGYEQGGELSNFVRANPQSVVVFDEVEKGAAEIYNKMLGGLQGGDMVDAQGNPIDLRNTILVFTSNINPPAGGGQGRPLGFWDESLAPATPPPQDALEADRLALVGHRDPRWNFEVSSELANRMDVVKRMNSLRPEDVVRMVDLRLRETAENLQTRHGITLAVAETAKAELARRGFHPQLGARPLTRVIEHVIGAEVAVLIGKAREQLRRSGKRLTDGSRIGKYRGNEVALVHYSGARKRFHVGLRSPTLVSRYQRMGAGAGLSHYGTPPASRSGSRTGARSRAVAGASR